MRQRTARSSALRKEFENTRNTFEAMLSVFCGATLVVVVLGAAKIFGLMGEWPPNQKIYDQKYADHIEEIANSDLGKTDPSLLELTKNKQGNNTEKDSNEKEGIVTRLSGFRDLHAQEGVWRASLIVAGMAVLQTLIGLVGLYLLARTLRATGDALLFTESTLNEARNTTRTANEATAAAVATANFAQSAEVARAYLEIEPYHPKKEAIEQHIAGQFFIKISAVNYGKTPATDFSCSIRARAKSESGPRDTGGNFSIHGGVIGPGIENKKLLGQMPKTNFSTDNSVYEISSDVVNSCLECTWQYRDIWGRDFKGNSYLWIRPDPITKLMTLSFAHSTGLRMVEDKN